jgi:hypothetical protein
MTNLPRRSCKERTTASVHKWGIQIENSNGFVIWRIPLGDGFDRAGLGRTIAALVEAAIDSGFKQGQEHVRNALGF